MPLEISRIRAICFDIDGTLSDTDDEWVSRIEMWLVPLARITTRRRLRQWARWLIMSAETPGNWIYEMLDRTGLDSLLWRTNRFLRHRAPADPPHFRLIPGVPLLLHILHRHFSLAVVSARDEESTHNFLHQFALSHYFRVIVTAQTTHHTKPFPEPILWAAQNMGVAPEQCLMVGDTPPDIRAAKAAGAQSVGVLCGFGTERELIRAGADLIIPSPVHLLPIFSHHPSLGTEQ